MNDGGTYPFDPRDRPVIYHPLPTAVESGQGVMTKTHPEGPRRPWGTGIEDDWVSGDVRIRKLPKEPNIVCGCGSSDFRVCLWEVRREVYIKIVCSSCGEEVERDYSF